MCRQEDDGKLKTGLEAIPPDERPITDEDEEDEDYPYVGGPS